MSDIVNWAGEKIPCQQLYRDKDILDKTVHRINKMLKTQFS